MTGIVARMDGEDQMLRPYEGWRRGEGGKGGEPYRVGLAINSYLLYS